MLTAWNWSATIHKPLGGSQLGNELLRNPGWQWSPHCVAPPIHRNGWTKYGMQYATIYYRNQLYNVWSDHKSSHRDDKGWSHNIYYIYIILYILYILYIYIILYILYIIYMIYIYIYMNNLYIILYITFYLYMIYI